jgi:NAD-dependent deacetylase
MESQIELFAHKILNAKSTVVFTGAGISVESGIPPFRGEHGIWDKYDPQLLEIDFFLHHPLESWVVIKEIFYDSFGKAMPNAAHQILGRMEQQELVECVITQNIDNLHQEGGSQHVHEFHGNSKFLVCTCCGIRQHVSQVSLEVLPVKCSSCNGLMKPDFVFFGEGIPPLAYAASLDAARHCDLMIVIGSLGEVMPAAMVPSEAKRRGAFIAEINPQPSNFTSSVTDLFIKGKAVEVMTKLAAQLSL